MNELFVKNPYEEVGESDDPVNVFYTLQHREKQHLGFELLVAMGSCRKLGKI